MDHRTDEAIPKEEGLGAKATWNLRKDLFAYILTISFLIVFRLAENYQHYPDKLVDLMMEVCFWVVIFQGSFPFSKVCTWICCFTEYVSLNLFYGLDTLITTTVFLSLYMFFLLARRYQNFEIWPHFGDRKIITKSDDP